MDFLLLANVSVGVLLAVSGVAKVRDRSATAEAFKALRLPAWLGRIGAPVLPWFELTLAAVLVVGAGRLLVVGAAAALVLMVTYTVVIGRALRFAEPVHCGCFGALGSGDVTVQTVMRNLLLSLLALLGLSGALAGVSLYSQPAWGWLALAALASAAVTLSLGTGAMSTALAGGGGWLRRATVQEVATGTSVSIGTLARAHAGVTLLFVQPGCGACQQVVDELATLRSRTPEGRVVVVIPERAPSDAFAEVTDLHRDPGSNLAAALGITATPAALAVGRIGAAEGELVVGARDVLALLGKMPEPAPGLEPATTEPEELDYVRRSIPNALLLDVTGEPHTLYELVAQRPALLVSFASAGELASEALALVGQWRQRLPILDVTPVYQFRSEAGSVGTAQDQEVLYDHGGLASLALRMRGEVSAVLLGADGLLAGGPVDGLDDIITFVDDVAREIAEVESV